MPIGKHQNAFLAKAILMDSQFWLPVAVLIFGILLLILVDRA